MEEILKGYESTSAPITKIKIVNNQLSKIDTYGIYNYFYDSDNAVPSKMIGAFINDVYVIEIGEGDKCDHYGMIVDIQEKYGANFNFYVASYGTELNFFGSKGLTLQNIDIILDIVVELKKYYIFSKKNKRICFIDELFPQELKNITSCEQLDELIISLNNLKKEYIEELYNTWEDDSNLFI